MTDSPIKIRKLQSGDVTYYYAAKALLDATDGEHSYEEIIGLIEGLKKIGFEVVKLAELPTANATAFASYEHRIVLIEDAASLTGACIEYVILRSGAEGSYTYSWEKIGTTSSDLTNYLTYNLQYNNAALSAGSHKHTVTVPTVTKTATKLSASVGNVAVGANGTAAVVKSYPGVSSKLVTATIVPAVANGTASKATAGTAVTYGNANVGTEVSVGTSLGGTKTFVTSAIKSATLDVVTTASEGYQAVVTGATMPTLGGTKTFVTGVNTGKAASWSAQVSNDGVLSFNWTANTPSTSAGTGTVSLNAGSATTKYIKVNTTNASTGTVTLNTTSITPAAASTSKITPYTFTDVSVAKVGTGVTVATGALASDGAGSSVLTGLGTASTATVLTGVKVSTQPTVTLVSGATGDVDVVSAVTVGSTTANTSETGAHTHNVKMTK